MYKTTNIPIHSVNLNTHYESENCYLCKGEFTLENHKVKDHDHLTGKYRGPACNTCNLKCRNDRLQIPVFFHNGKNYDFQHIINSIATAIEDPKQKLNCIALNSEKF